MEYSSQQIERLAKQAADAKRAGREDEANGRLGEIARSRCLERIASRILARYGNPRGVEPSDLSQDLFLRISEQIQHFDASRAPFRVWANTICRNLLVSQLRRRRETTASNPHVFSDETEGATLVEPQSHDAQVAFNVDWESPFSEADWNCFCTWAEQNERDPVVVAVGHFYWRKLLNEPDSDKQQQWRGWFTECGIDDADRFFERLERDCDAPKPRQALENRLRLLGESVGLRYNSIWQDWNRKRHLAAELEFFWGTALVEYPKLTDEQVECVFAAVPNDRVPVLCIDQYWPRANGAAQWSEMRNGFRFRGIPPLLRFLELPTLGDRIDCFAKAIPGQRQENYQSIIKILAWQSSLRAALQAES